MGENILKLIKPADIVTLGSAILGFASIIFINHGEFENALILILVAVIADSIDGAIARKSGFGVLGANLDSLADVISFGIAPATAAFVYLENAGVIAWVSAVLFLSCGILRLARFNVEGKKDGFEGIPITAGGFIVALFLLTKDEIPNAEHLFVLVLFVISFLMVGRISYPKMKSPGVLVPVGILLVLDIAGFYRTISSFLLLLLVSAYVFIPVIRRFHDRNK
jgi:archaetidylserine synthase